MWDMWDNIGLSRSVGWLEMKFTCYFILWVCGTVGCLQKNTKNISMILVGNMGQGKAFCSVELQNELNLN